MTSTISDAVANIAICAPDSAGILELRELTKYYDRRAVVDNVSFTVHRGEITGYLGPNGSGKSTTVKMITALLDPSNGTVFYEGRDVRDDLLGFRRRLGYVPEEAILYSYMSGLEYLQLIGGLRGLPQSTVDRKANDLLELFSLHPHRHATIATYSKGMKQRVLIASALLHDPDLLILDEPLSGMDVTSAELFKHLLQKLALKGKTILYISHVLEVVEKVCSKVIIIFRGKIIACDTVERLRDHLNLPTLIDIFSQVTEQKDLEAVASDIVSVVSSR